MAVPKVSHENWEKVRGLAQIEMETMQVKAGSISFAKQLEKITSRGVAFQEAIEDRETEQNRAKFKAWPDGVKIRIHPDDRDRPHRPEVDDDLVEQLDETAAELFPGVPVEELSFDDTLGLVVDELENTYKKADCHLIQHDIPTNWT
jgi:hypothetical protein